MSTRVADAVVVACADLDAYRRAVSIAARAALADSPVLVLPELEDELTRALGPGPGLPPGTSLDRLDRHPAWPHIEPLLGGADAAETPAGDGLVVALGDGAWLAVAEAQAALGRATLLRAGSLGELPEVLDGREPRPLTLVGPPERFPIGDLAAGTGLVGEVDAAGVRLRLLRWPSTIMTARSPGLLSRLVARGLLHTRAPGDGHLLLTSGLRGELDGPDPNVRVQGLDGDAPLADAAGRPLETLVVCAHATDDYVRTNTRLICGLSGRPDAGSVARPLPQCCFGQGCVIADVAITRIGEVRAHMVGAIACDSFKLGANLFGPDFDLALSAVEGWCSAYVGAHQIADVRPDTALFLRNLLLSGRSLGEAVRQVNNGMVVDGTPVPVLCALGDAGWRSGARREAAWTCRAEPAADGWQVTFEGLDRVLQVECAIADPALAAAAVRGDVRVETDAADLEDERVAAYHVVPEPDGTGVRLHVDFWHPASRAVLTCRVNSGEERTGLRRALEDAQANGWLLRTWGPVQETLKGRLHDLERQQVHLARLQAAGLHTFAGPAAERRTLRRLETVLASTAQAGMDVIVNLCYEGRLRLIDEVMAQSRMERTGPPTACPHCGAAATLSRLDHWSLPIHQVWLFCPRCGLVSTACDPPSVEFTIAAERMGRVPSGRPIERELRVRNLRAHPVVGSAGLQVRNGRKREAAVTPRLVDFRLAPFEEGRFAVVVSTPRDLQPHAHWLIAYAIANLGVYSFSERVVVEGTRPRLPVQGDRLERPA